MASGVDNDAGKAVSPRLVKARRDAVVLIVLIAAVMMLIWNGSAFVHEITIAHAALGQDVSLASAALTLNVALILFGWRRYGDLQHEAEMRADGERRAALLATTEPTTGLLNRKGFADRAGALCASCGSATAQLVIVSIQIHRFKTVNDQHGHETGDALLRELAAALTANFDDSSAVGRLAADEFAIAVIMPADEIERAEGLADAALHGVSRPFAIGERIIQVGAFAGIAAAPAAQTRIPDLLRRADIAMDHAKSGRVARPVWFDDGMERALLAHGEIEQGIRFGLQHGQFVPYFEPQVDLASGNIIGFEVLARWKHPLSGSVGPDVFIPVAEEIGLIGQLSEQVIGAALREAAAWDPTITISVNISPSQFADGWLAHRIVRLLTETGFPAERLVIEVTESSLFADVDLARSIVTSLKNQGVRLALDDFGTGFSSLAHLRSLPFDVIKIDRSFLSDVHENRESIAIIRAVTTLANALSVPVCIEGIEAEPAFRTVMGLGCEIGQGWYFGKAMTADDARELLSSRARRLEEEAPPADCNDLTAARS
ncbi:GGDEF domain-containing phosphodiesterase [Sphingomonas sp.]|uniref:putative bifunctional diguanylate cyclase/phosphodiesterase n=1 Tax=Sphingomonas sp. TaxID=28214 RepID=UPI0025F98BBB|nr:GGDEF domain-containing phosphodiesterase [Sphingomonas sp.]MBV9527695.1 EAL domain-containing protein [Sphingomonas sp.]